MGTIRVLLVDDHAVCRAALRMLLEAADDIQVVGEAAGEKDALERSQELKPDVVVLNLSKVSSVGLETAQQILSRSPESRTLVLTLHDSEECFYEILRVGAAGYVPRQATPSELLAAIRSVHQGGSYLHQAVVRVMLDDYIKRFPVEKTSEGSSPLTEREKQVLRLIAEGHTSREIADALFVSPNTVQSHRNSIYEKLALHNSAELTAYAIRAGLVVADP